jgi:hypothetical protein
MVESTMIMKKPTIIAASAFQGFRGPDTSKEFQRFTRSQGPASRVPPGDRGVAVFMWLAPSHPSRQRPDRHPTCIIPIRQMRRAAADR